MTAYLWRIKPSDPDWGGTGCYYSAVVCAKTEEQACSIHPGRNEYKPNMSPGEGDIVWPENSDLVVAEKIGIAESHIKSGTVVLADFT